MNMSPEQKDNVAPAVETATRIISLIGACIGLAVIIIGLKYAMDIFQLIFTMLKSPASLTDPITQLASSFGGSSFDLKLTDRTVPLARIVALLVYCCGVLLSAFLTLALMHTGAKILSLTACDRNAVKLLLRSAFGGSLRPQKASEDETVKTRD